MTIGPPDGLALITAFASDYDLGERLSRETPEAEVYDALVVTALLGSALVGELSVATGKPVDEWLAFIGRIVAKRRHGEPEE